MKDSQYPVHGGPVPDEEWESHARNDFVRATVRAMEMWVESVGDSRLSFRRGSKHRLYIDGNPYMQWAFSAEQINWDLQDHTPEEIDFLKRHLTRPDSVRHTLYNDFVYFHVVNEVDLNVAKQLILRRLGKEKATMVEKPRDAWDEFIHWVRKFRKWDQFDEQERDYKLQIARNVKAARHALETGSDDWLRLLRRVYGAPNNITSYFAHGKFLDWCTANTETAKQVLHDLWFGAGEPEERLTRFLEMIPRESLSGPGSRVNVASLLLMGVDEFKYPPYKVTPYHRGFRLTKFYWPDQAAGEAVIYPHALEFLDRILSEARGRGVKLRDRLDAQSVLYSITHWGPLDHWSDHEKEAFRAYQRGETPPPRPGSTLKDLAGRLLLDDSYLERVDTLLQSKKQLIFYGPPGTGKTYVARELAKHYARDGGKVELVQFHPSYAYEDFVEGYRPSQTASGQPGFQLAEGPLKRIAEAAMEDPEAKFILVIDEINRGNVAKVLGELYFLLEYRDEEISLQYSSEPFSLPENLWVIGTMNTADRSIALIDAALRRRFYFVPFMPDEPPVRGLLRRWLQREQPDLVWVADAVDRANEILGDRHMAIGPSYFMKPDLDERWVNLIWEHSILPYIAEQYFGEEDRLEQFQLDRLRGLKTPETVGSDATADTE